MNEDIHIVERISNNMNYSRICGGWKLKLRSNQSAC